MYGIKYTLPNGQETYLALKRNGGYKVSENRKDIAEFDDEYEAIYTATEMAKKIYKRNIDFTLLWHA